MRGMTGQTTWPTPSCQQHRGGLWHGGGAGSGFGDSGERKHRVGSHHFNNNLYYGNPTTIIFPNLERSWNENWSLAEWQANRGEDLESLKTPPNFAQPTAFDYTLRPGSAAIDAGRYLPEVTEDSSGLTRPQGPRTDIGAYEH